MTLAGLNLIQQALSIYDDDLRLVLCNARFREMFDLPPQITTPGAGFDAAVRWLVEHGEYGPLADPEAAIAERVEQARTFQPHYIERRRANGRMISVEGAPLPAGGWVTVYTDITEIKAQEALLRARSEELHAELLTRAEQLTAANRQLQATNAALAEAKRELTAMEARTRQTTEMMPAHIAHLGPDRRYTFSNRRLSTIMPGRPSNIVGLHIADVLGTQAYRAVQTYLEGALQGRASTFEFTDQASSRRIRVALNPDHDAGCYILSTDVTHETQTRTALQQTRRRALAAQVTSGMAHDFSNLLTIILGMQARLATVDLPGNAGDLVAATLGAARRGGDLLNRIADMTSGPDHRPAATEMAGFLDNLATLATAALPETIRLEIRDDTDDARLMLDRGMLQDSLLNLVLNARDSCAGSGVISIRAAPVKDTWLEITVTDTGSGFSETALNKALDPFFSTKGGEGSGLGLAMVYNATKLAGGRVRLANLPDGGARVTLRLPWRTAPCPLDPGLVLLVEDSADLRRSIRDMLRDAGHAVIEATSVDEATSLAAEVPGITLILSDISLEGADTGIDLLNRLPSSAPPCYLMTSLRSDHPLFIAATARTPVLRKPFGAAQLAGFLRGEAAP
ncbi:PAS-domain containing protein [Pseudooceanicola sp.]|uniref:PAS-domain containing protein n=1 Tax=Pseudooceanicola sp. TaxID=1914328 RepID=UPI0026386682|nr:PAS-domain containing protein [Pseudooceanicola sp.]MDF1855707.1 PAS-domain containing protein [Pseudooceanicola sp.]